MPSDGHPRNHARREGFQQWLGFSRALRFLALPKQVHIIQEGHNLVPIQIHVVYQFNQ